WGPQDDNDSIAAIHKAIDLGINWIDTAAVYGLGHSEEVVARALKTASKKPYVFTKSSMVWDDKKEIINPQKQIRRECEASPPLQHTHDQQARLHRHPAIPRLLPPPRPPPQSPRCSQRSRVDPPQPPLNDGHARRPHP